MRKIVTSHEYPPIPVRSFDWVAYFEGDEEGGPRGYGATEEEAIADLRAENPADAYADAAMPLVRHDRPLTLRVSREWLREKIDSEEEGEVGAGADLLTALKVAKAWLDFEGKYDMQAINMAIAKAEGRS